MGLGPLGQGDVIFKRKFRWMVFIDEGQNIAGINQGANILPPAKSSRPNFSFKELEAQHLTETIYFPGKPDWKPINLTLYDVVKDKHPVFDWIALAYNPNRGTFSPSIGTNFKKGIKLCLYDPSGYLVEQWNFDNAWPQVVEFGDLDMNSEDVVLCDITLRYDRAYITHSGCYPKSTLYDNTTNTTFNLV